MMSQAYVPCVTAAGLLVIGHCLSTLMREPLEFGWLALAGLTLLTGAFTIKIPSLPVRLSVSETFVFASVLLFGTCAGTITVALEILVVIIAGTGRLARDPIRILFNVSSATLSIWLASHAFYFIADIPPLSRHEAALHTLIVPLAVMATCYFLLNSGMVAAAVAIQRREPIFAMWRTNFLGLAVNYFAGASLAALFVSYTRTIDLFALGIIVPLLIISYLTFKTSFAKVEDATKHVEEIRKLYLSTIETLATAIDAKDQVTHGHIRRVQQFALGLAKELGIQDKAQLQALEAAALLHDTGKLVIPEHILNKPGKLTRGEFEKMKEHAAVGADILSSIDFPFPVVPIVRHHHENWDGTGYPDRLKGTGIPIGARILAVVDCYDALTSDRPYRPRMTDAEALAILTERRGLMYDPLVVDAFTTVWQSLVASIVEPHTEIRATTKVQRAGDAAPGVVHPLTYASGAYEPLMQVTAAALQKTAAAFAVLFAVDSERDSLVSLVTMTPDTNSKESLVMALGSGVSGWVAVNGSVVINAEAALDFRQPGYRADLVRIICVPVRIRGSLVGVLSVYSTDKRGFSSDDTELLNSLAASLDTEAIAQSFHRVLHSQNNTLTSQTTIH